MLPKASAVYKGFWSSPSAPERKIAGTLSVDPSSGLILETTGTISGKDLIFGRGESFVSVHGLAAGNQYITLLGVMSGGTQWSANGITLTSYEADIAIIGSHVIDPTKMRLTKLFAEYDCLAIWLNISPFSIEVGERQSFSIKHCAIDDIILFDDHELKIGIGWVTQPPGSKVAQTEVYGKTTPELFIRATESMPYEALLAEAGRFRMLLSLWIGAPIKMTKMRG